MSEPNSPKYEISIPDDPELRSLGGLTNSGDVVMVFKKPSTDTLLQDGTLMLARMAHILEMGHE